MRIYSKILIAFLGCLYVLHSECSSTIKGAGGEVIVGEKGKDVTLRWNFFNIGHEHFTMSFFFNKVDDANRLGFANEYRFNIFNERISEGKCQFSNNNGQCVFKLSALTFKDSGFYIAAKDSLRRSQVYQNVSLIVKERTQHCGSKSLPLKFKRNVGENIIGNVTLCGKPKPKVIWYIGNKIIKNTAVDDSLKGDHKYTYSFQLTTKPWMCGQNISYYGTGFKNNVSGSAVVFIPDYKVTDMFFTQTAGCPILSWKLADHGHCEVKMVLSLRQMNNSIINVTVPAANETYNDCNFKLNSTGFTYETIVYLNNNGNRIQTSINKDSEYLVLTTTTNITTMTATKTTPYNTIGSKDFSQSQDHFPQLTLKIIGSSIGGILSGILLTTIALRIWSRRGNVKANVEKVELQSTESRKISLDDHIKGDNRKQPNALSKSKIHVYEDTYEYSNVTDVSFYEVNEQTVLPKPTDNNLSYGTM